MASSILTDASALTALQNLAATDKALSAAQSNVSSGLKVASASDSAAYWSIASAMKSARGGLSAVSDALDVEMSVLGVASAAVAATLTLVSRIKADLVAAQQPGSSPAQVQTDITAQQRNLLAVLASASFNGTNLLDGSSGTSVSFITGYAATSQNASTLTTASLSTKEVINLYTGQIDSVQLAGAGGILSRDCMSYPGVSSTVWGVANYGNGASYYNRGSILCFDVTTATRRDLSILSTYMDVIIGDVVSVGAQLGSASSIVSNQRAFVSGLSAAITSGVGSLVDADMSVASTRLRALQVQRQLGIEALSIANQNSRLVLKLFQAA